MEFLAAEHQIFFHKSGELIFSFLINTAFEYITAGTTFCLSIRQVFRCTPLTAGTEIRRRIPAFGKKMAIEIGNKDYIGTEG